MKYEAGEIVKVTDPDGHKWLGIVDCPSVLWANWYVVRRYKRGDGKTGRMANLHVHASEMERK